MIDTFLSTNAKFWWNWGTTVNVDLAQISNTSAAKFQSLFTPMVWGVGELSDYSFMDYEEDYVMGWNEPDQYGPACCNCDGKQTYSPATSSGWFNVFNPVTAAPLWQEFIGQITANGTRKVTKLVSPSMAQSATKNGTCGQDPSVPGNTHYCPGWLSMFKTLTLTLDCTSLTGASTNCWDAIDVIQIHAYAKTAEEVLQKIDGYYSEFQEDFEGTNGRSKKTLWLTEVAAGTSDSTKIVPFVEGLMNSKTGLTNRDKYGFVQRCSWFSEYFFASFNVSGVVPGEFETWSSSLFNPFGGLSPVGEKFFSYC